MEHNMTEKNNITIHEYTDNTYCDASIDPMHTQAAEAVEAAEDADTNPAEAEPAEAESVEAEAPEAEPAQAEQAEAEPAEAEPAEAEEAAAEGNADADYRRRLRKYTKELKELPGQWYIIQCYSGYENKVKTNLDMRAQTLEVEDSIFDVVVPIEQVLENKDGKKKLVKRKLLPGYVLVRMELNDAAWSVVRDTPGV